MADRWNGDCILFWTVHCKRVLNNKSLIERLIAYTYNHYYEYIIIRNNSNTQTLYMKRVGKYSIISFQVTNVINSETARVLFVRISAKVEEFRWKSKLY